MIHDPLPFTGGDLRDLADGMDEIEATELAASKTVRRIEMKLPDADERIGWAVRFDEDDPDMGWGLEVDRT